MGNVVDRVIGRPTSEGAQCVLTAFREVFMDCLKETRDSRWSEAEANFVNTMNKVDEFAYPFTLDLSGAYFGEVATHALCKIVQYHQAITELRLVGCEIPSISCVVLKKLFLINHHLVRVDLSNNSLRSVGLQMLFQGLHCNSTIQYLGLRKVSGDDLAVPGLVKLISKNKYLTTIDFRHNYITEKGFDKLVTGVKDACHLLFLDLRGNEFDESIIEARLQPLLNRNNIAAQIVQEEILDVIPYKNNTYNFSIPVEFTWTSMLKNCMTPKPTKSSRFDVGWADTIGRRPTMEDKLLIMGDFDGQENTDLFCVFDGHGGKQVADYLGMTFATAFRCKLDECDGDVLQAYRKTYWEIDITMLHWAQYIGSTALTAFFKDNVLYMANAGDSRAVIRRGNKSYRISVDHKPTDPDEHVRIQSVGGVVIDARVGGVLAVSRAFGDWFLHPAVIADPCVNRIELCDEDEFVILACDGLWDVMTDEHATDFVEAFLSGSLDDKPEKKVEPASQKRSRVIPNRAWRGYGRRTFVPKWKKPQVQDAQGAAEMLRAEAYKLGSMDNISIIVILLKPRGWRASA